jgi:threonine/homoserine/homoserine lactone efflux protein
MQSQLALAALVFGATLTPGPNNLALLDVAARGGRRAALPAIAAIVIGGLALYALVHLGLGVWAARHPWIHSLMLACSVGYLLWLGWGLVYRSLRPAPAPPALTAPTHAPALLAFQFVNPKGWLLMISVSAAAQRAQGSTRLDQMLAPALLVLLPTISLLLWLVLCTGVRRFSGLDVSKPAVQGLAGLLLIASAASFFAA